MSNPARKSGSYYSSDREYRGKANESRETLLAEIRRQEPPHLKEFSRVTHVVFVSRHLSDSELAQKREDHGLVTPKKPRRGSIWDWLRGPKGDQTSPSDFASQLEAIRHSLKQYRLSEGPIGRDFTIDKDNTAKDGSCIQGVTFFASSFEQAPQRNFRVVARRVADHEYTSHTFFLDEAGPDGAVDHVIPGVPGLAESTWYRTLSMRAAELAELATSRAPTVDPFDFVVKDVLPDYGGKQEGLEPESQFLLGADYVIIPAAAVFQPDYLEAFLNSSKQASKAGQDLALVKFLFGEDWASKLRANSSYGRETLRGARFAEMMADRTASAQFDDFFMRLAKPIYRGAFRTDPGEAELSQVTGFEAPSTSFFASRIDGAGAYIMSDLRPHLPFMFSRTIVFDMSLNAFARGRLINKCCEIAANRIWAMRDSRALAEAYEVLRSLNVAMNSSFLNYASQAQDAANVGSFKRALVMRDQLKALVNAYDRVIRLNELTTIGITESCMRANRLYDVVEERVAALRETPLVGHQTLKEFLDRRLKRVVRAMNRTAHRYQAVRDRIQDNLSIIRTDVDTIEREEKTSVTIWQLFFGAVGMLIGLNYLPQVWLKFLNQPMDQWILYAVLAAYAAYVVYTLYIGAWKQIEVWRRRR